MTILRAFRKTLPGITLIASFCSVASAGFQEDVGFTKLKGEYGSSLPALSGVRVLQIEYPRNGSWAPQASGDLTGKLFTYLSPYSAFSSHANEVGAYLAGSSVSMTPSIAAWSSSEATAFTGRGNLNGTRALAPIPATWDIENHSWGGNDPLWGLQILQKQDFRIDRDNIVSVAGVDNGSTLSMVMANSYNTISVGVSNGNHPRQGTSLDVLGRVKPDLVAPAAYTSYATPIVASGAAILLGEIKRNSALALARSPMVVKALIMAGATKEEFPAWTHTTQYPLDRTYGAGEFNIYNSYKSLLAGRQIASNISEVSRAGWDANSTTTTARRLYFFSVPAGQKMKLSAVLAWHRRVTTDSTWTSLKSSLANLDLKLYRASNYAVGSMVSASASVIDNVEHIYQTTLLAGQYALEVTSNIGGEKYGLAWRSTLVRDGSGSSPLPTGGFESPDLGAPSWSAYRYNPAVVSGTQDWRFEGTSGIAGLLSGFTVKNPSAPEGKQVAFLQKNSSVISRNFNFPAAGKYKVSVSAAQRGNYNAARQTLAVYLNSSYVGAISPVGTAYQRLQFTFSTSGGSHRLSFRGTASTDSTVLIDDVELAPTL